MRYNRVSKGRFAVAAAVLVCCYTQDQAFAGDGPDLGVGEKLFTQTALPPCAVCHTLADAGATGKIGPNLDVLQPDSDSVYAAVKGGLGVMPAYKDALSEQQLQAIAAYVAEASGGG